MTSTVWRVALGVVASSAFFWGVAGNVDLGLERTRNGYTHRDGGEWYTYTLFAGFVVAYFSVARLTDTTAARYAALVPAAGAWSGVLSCVLMGQQTRHWVAAAVMALIGSVVPLVVHLRRRTRRARSGAGAPA
ncbi:hypothetical protein ACIA8O_01750 [Kitasatospora sp. NPDC051853]|uniref:hypothetical protein n=1 Tax=Kitasatospora sp. NPDC051853 TaxID=3364058 RepID=UPI0037B1CCDD